MKKRQTLSVRFLSLLSVFILLFNMVPMLAQASGHDPNDENYDYDLRFWEDEKPDIGFYINSAARYTLETVPEPTMGTSSGEWSVMNLLRGMYTGYDYLNDIDDGYFTGYLDRIESYVNKKNGVLSEKKSTEWSRLILSLSSLDYDIKDVAGYDFIEKLSESHNFSYRQGINGPIWEIIAMNTGDYKFYPDKAKDDVNTFGKMIDYILNLEIEQNDGTKGGWALAFNTPDPDITGMALQAFAPYYGNESLYNETGAKAPYSEFVKSVERGVSILADVQADNGAFKAFDNTNVESTVQVIVALTALGIDPLSDSVNLSAINEDVSFISKGAIQDGVQSDNMIDGLLAFWADGSGSEPGVGGFKHVISGNDGGGDSGYGVNGMATDQALYGLIAYDRFLNDENALYDMTDMMSKKNGTPHTEYEASKLNVNFEGLDETKKDEVSPYGIIEIPEGKSSEGKQFTHWTTESNGDGTIYSPGEKLSMPDHDITLYAQDDNIEYSIDYEINGGKFNSDDIVETYTVDDEVTLPTADDIKKEDYDLVGWYKNDNFDGNSIAVLPTGSYGDKTFYAKWEEISSVDQDAIESVEKMIEELSDAEDVRITDKEAVVEAREAYEDLTEESQDLVSNIDKLVAVENALEKIDEEVSITTDLEENLETKADKLTFDLFAKDKDGNKISTSDIDVTNNDAPVSINWDDDKKTSYTLDLEVGENNVKIVVKDKYILEYNIIREYAEDGDVIGTYTFSLEGFTIGIGHIIEPVELDIIKGENAANALLRALDDNGIEYEHWAFPSFYLEYIFSDDNSKIYKNEPKIPDVLKEALGKGNYPDDGYMPNGLGEFDFGPGSGWMYSVKNVFPNVGFADYYLSDGDVLRTQYTLALGADLGGGTSSDLFDISNKDELTKKIAEINSSNEKEEYLSVELQKEAYDHAMDTLHKVNANQSETDDALEKIEQAEETETNKQLAQKIDEQIKALPSVDELTLDDKKLVEKVYVAYEQLTSDQKELVKNIEKLNELEEKLAELEADEKKDKEKAKEVEDMINSLPEVAELTLDEAKDIKAAREEFDSLSSKQKKLVPNKEKLIELEEKLAELEADKKNDKEKAKEIENMINSLPEVAELTLGEAEDVEAAREEFDNLSAKQKKLVPNEEKLSELEAKLTELTAVNKEDKKKAKKVEDTIQALPSVSKVELDDEKSIQAARVAFNTLSDKQKTLVPNEEKLIELEAKLIELEAEHVKDKEKAQEVEAMINNLPSSEKVSLDDKESIEKVRESFETLTDDQQTLVSNEEKLTDLELKLKELATNEEDGNNQDDEDEDVTEGEDDQVNELEDLITSLPDSNDFTSENMNLILEILSAYEALTDDQKQQVTNFDEFIDLIKELDGLESFIDDPELESDIKDKLAELGSGSTGKQPDKDKGHSEPKPGTTHNQNVSGDGEQANQQEGLTKNLAGDQSQRLPDTATNMFNYLLGGILFIVLGTVLFFARRKKSL